MLWKSAWLPNIHLRIKISIQQCQPALLMGVKWIQGPVYELQDALWAPVCPAVG